jgi:sporulation protein YlmC with PRC-barrel domain
MFNGMRSTARFSEKLDDTTSDRLVGMTSLIQDDVYDAADNCLGEIKEIILDARTGCVRYVVLALGGFLGIGRKRFAVPWSVLSPDANYQRSIVDVTLMQLTAVPVPQNDPWLQRVDRRWSKENTYLARRRAISDIVLPKRHSTFLKLGSSETEALPKLEGEAT